MVESLQVEEGREQEKKILLHEAVNLKGDHRSKSDHRSDLAANLLRGKIDQGNCGIILSSYKLVQKY